ncbi:helix-turn-helix domain-containing protein [Microbacterium sp. LWO14-1.2]|uniref:helix-turn-helix transcriptional regulator n=1 Tax=Microbacterium sp. LWO14-1.2 TaxID=3135263 RepID=UPI00313A4130
MNADEITGELVHLAMRRRRVTQSALGEVLGITQPAMGKKLYGQRSWTIDEVLAVAKYFEMPVTELLPGEDYQPIPEGRGRVNAETASTEVEAVSSLSQHSVRPKGLEPLTF